jgi:hypothetical protein
MKNFNEWLKESAATDTTSGMGAFKDALGSSFDEKNDQYAKRIIAGEDPHVVMSGVRVGGVMWQKVMQRVEEIKAGNKPVASNQVSVSDLEKRIGIPPNALSLTMSRDNKYAFVRNRHTGQSVNVQPDPASIEKAARQLFGK